MNIHWKATAIATALPRIVFGNISEINTQFKNIAYSVFYGQATPAEAAQQFYDEANNILATNN